MALLNVPASVVKGVPAQVTLIKSDVLLLPEVQADSFWTQNGGEDIYQVWVDYRSSVGAQRKVLIFNFSDANPTTSVEFSTKSRPQFEISKITLVDFDGGKLVINRDALLVTFPTLTNTNISPQSESPPPTWGPELSGYFLPDNCDPINDEMFITADIAPPEFGDLQYVVNGRAVKFAGVNLPGGMVAGQIYYIGSATANSNVFYGINRWRKIYRDAALTQLLDITSSGSGVINATVALA
jgi:hypothetical protein